MQQALAAAGFPGVEEADGVIYARLGGNGPEFQAMAAPGGGWWLSLCYPVRLGPAELIAWNANHPQSGADLHEGETRLRMLCDGGQAALALWARDCDEMLSLALRYRRGQRLRGEGM